MQFSSFLQFALLAMVVLGHPRPDKHLSSDEIARRELGARGRQLRTRNCASHIDQFIARRKARRDLMRRGFSPLRRQASTTSSAPTPHYTEIQNFTCVTAPEVTEDPYYINNEQVRYNQTEDQIGIQLVLDIGVLNIETCEPVPNAFVEIWAANATGVYSSYPAQLPAPPTNTTTSLAVSSTPASSSTLPLAAGAGTIPMERNETFLRGGLATNDNGIVELATIYPGFSTGRTAHINTMVHLKWERSENGTVVSHAGSLLHIGQFFFTETWNDMVFGIAPYNTSTNNRTLNVDDEFMTEANANGYSAFLDLELLGDDFTAGVLGYITVGVNVSSSYTIQNNNYLNSSTETASDTTSLTVTSTSADSSVLVSSTASTSDATSQTVTSVASSVLV